MRLEQMQRQARHDIKFVPHDQALGQFAVCDFDRRVRPGYHRGGGQLSHMDPMPSRRRSRRSFIEAAVCRNRTGSMDDASPTDIYVSCFDNRLSFLAADMEMISSGASDAAAG